jgi:F0F1-type ATP synthase membrane subunit b/b'
VVEVPVEQLQAMVDDAVAQAVDSAEERIRAHVDRELEEMAKSASRRLNREAARIRAEVTTGTPSTATRSPKPPS